MCLDHEVYETYETQTKHKVTPCSTHPPPLPQTEEGDQDFLVKIGSSPFRGWGWGLSIEGGGRGGEGKHCFLLIMYRFWSSNALYSASLSFRMFIFLLTPFDTSGCYYFGLNLSQVLLIKVFFVKKHVTLFFSLLKMEKYLYHMSLFLCLFCISLG